MNGLKRTDQFSMLCIVGVWLCILSVCLSKRFEITCVQHRAASVFSLSSVFFFFFLLFISSSDRGRSHPRTELTKWTYLRCVKKVISYCAMSNCFITAPKCKLPAVPWQRVFWKVSNVSPLLSHYDLLNQSSTDWFHFTNDTNALYQWCKVVVAVRKRVKHVSNCDRFYLFWLTWRFSNY